MNLTYLNLRGQTWWYNRRIPQKFAHLDTRERIRISLNTDSRDRACSLRDELVRADNEFWAALVQAHESDNRLSSKQIAATELRYRAAKRRALAGGFEYRSVSLLAQEPALDEILDRLLVIQQKSGEAEVPRAKDAEAFLGGVEIPKVSISRALEIYFEEIALDEQLYKSEHQKYQWRKVKKRSIAYFIDHVDDIAISEITREQALSYKKYWVKRMTPSDPSVKSITASTANRNIGNIRALYREYFKHIGEETRDNPFRNINFAAKTKTEVPPFENDWIKSRILSPGILKGIRAELQLITLMLIETGCRPSEIINLQPEDIAIEVDVPHIKIKARPHGKGKRELKTASSEREIPLVGVSLEAAKRADGKAFKHYQDRNELFSANLMGAFRNRSLFPTVGHKIYSFRHSFEKRMQEANIDYGLRCLLMGHKTDRPAYGDGGSLAYRREELMKICFGFDKEIFEVFDVEHADWSLKD